MWDASCIESPFYQLNKNKTERQIRGFGVGGSVRETLGAESVMSKISEEARTKEAQPQGSKVLAYIRKETKKRDCRLYAN